MSTLDPARAALIRRLPKVELHVHIEGTIEPELMFALATKHGIALPYKSVEEVRAAYKFEDLQSFLDLYYAGCDVLRDRDDFRALAGAYFDRAAADHVVHAELFFDPQTHTVRGVAMATILEGLHDAMADARAKHGITSSLILCFLRHLSGEQGNPPSKFVRVFAKARAAKLHAVAHAGEEGPAAYIREALTLLEVERIDHGVRCDEDPALVNELALSQVPLTVCPLSNKALRVTPDLSTHNFAKLLRAGVAVTINSDDPAYFGGYITENYLQTAEALDLTADELVTIAENAVRGAFIGPEEKDALLVKIRDAAVNI
jgi:adenosine deaminase